MASNFEFIDPKGFNNLYELGILRGFLQILAFDSLNLWYFQSPYKFKAKMVVKPLLINMSESTFN